MLIHMNRLRLLLVPVLVAAVSGALRAQNPAAPAASDRLLHVTAVAADRQGNPVADLKREDLEVWINGSRIPIETVTNVAPTSGARRGRLIVLLLDDVTVNPFMVPRVKEVARRFVTKLLPEDRMAIVRVGGDTVEFTSDPSRLLKRVDSYNQSAGFVPPEHLGVQVLETVASIARGMSEAPEPRKAIVGIGSGWLFDTPIPPPQIGGEVRREWLDAVRALAVADAHLYVIDPAGVGAMRGAMGNDGFARDAGGHAFTNTNDLAGAADRVLRDGESYYVIIVKDPPVGRGAAVRDLDVRSMRRDVTVRARRIIPSGS